MFPDYPRNRDLGEVKRPGFRETVSGISFIGQKLSQEKEKHFGSKRKMTQLAKRFLKSSGARPYVIMQRFASCGRAYSYACRQFVLMNDLSKWVREELSWEVNDKYVQWNQTCQIYTFIVGLTAIPGKQ